MSCCLPKECTDCVGCGSASGDSSDGAVTGIKRKGRHCTDVPMLLGFIAFTAWMIYFIYGQSISVKQWKKYVNYYILIFTFLLFVFYLLFCSIIVNVWFRLSHGTAYNTEICGVDENVKHLPYAYWTSPMDFRFKKCTDRCEVTNEDGAPLKYKSKLGMYAYLARVFLCLN